MINALLVEYPDSLVIDDQEYLIETDFRRWIGLNEAMQDTSLTDEEKGYLILSLFSDEVPDGFDAAIMAVASFLQGNIYEWKGKVSSTTVKKKSRYVFSFTYDQDYIIGAFLECYQIDLINIDYMHWWHFNALLNALNGNCELKQRISIRSTKLSDIADKKERNRIRKLQHQIMIPAEEMSDEEIASVF